jgi:ribosome maturation factor RimP
MTTQRAAIDAHVGNRPELIARFVGQKVAVATRDFHHVVGVLRSFEADDVLRLTVRGRQVQVARASLANIRAVDDAIAEYVK